MVAVAVVGETMGLLHNKTLGKMNLELSSLAAPMLL
jgi:hypothetical protein